MQRRVQRDFPSGPPRRAAAPGFLESGQTLDWQALWRTVRLCPPISGNQRVFPSVTRRAEGERESKKRPPPAPIPRPLLAHLHRWKRQGARHVVEVGEQRVGCLETAWRTALEEAGIDYYRPHDLRYTSVTWAMQRGTDKWAAAGYFGMTFDTLESVYGHHHPDHLCSAVEAMDKKA